jgi:TIR domain
MSKQVTASPKQETKVFISYRREDSAGHAGRLFDRISSHFGDTVKIFMDIDSITPGEDFVNVIENAVGSCAILIAIIGMDWLTVTDEAGKRRLDNPEDFVRVEIATALNRGVRVIPVLVQDANMPRREHLPEALVKLSRRNAIEISDVRWNYDVNRLIKTIEGVLNRQQSRNRMSAQVQQFMTKSGIWGLKSWQILSASILTLGIQLSLGIWLLVQLTGNTNVNSNSSNGQSNSGPRTGNTALTSNTRNNSAVPTSETKKLIQVVRVIFNNFGVQGFFTSKGYIISYGGEEFVKKRDDVTVLWSEGGQNYNEVAQVTQIYDRVALLKLKNRGLFPHYLPIRLSVSLQKGEEVERLIGPEDRTPGKVLEVNSKSMLGTTPVLVTTRIAYAGDVGAPVVDSQGKIVAMIFGLRGDFTETESIPIEEIKIRFPEAF